MDGREAAVVSVGGQSNQTDRLSKYNGMYRKSFSNQEDCENKRNIHDFQMNSIGLKKTINFNPSVQRLKTGE